MDSKFEIINSMMDIQKIPSIDSDIDLKKYEKLPIEDATLLSLSVAPILEIIKNNAPNNLYRVYDKFKKPITLSCKTSDGLNIGAYMSNGLTQQARFKQVCVAPELASEMILAGITLFYLNKNFKDIKEYQVSILEREEIKDKSNILGDIHFLEGIINDYKYNWNNQLYKSTMYIKVQDIKLEAIKYMNMYNKLLYEELNKRGTFVSKNHVDVRLHKILKNLKIYQISLYLYSFSIFLESMLLENFRSEYLKSIADSIEKCSIEYRELYTDAYNKIESYFSSSLENIMIKSATLLNDAVQYKTSKVPLINKLTTKGNPIDCLNRTVDTNTKKSIGLLIANKNAGINQFIENIRFVDSVYNCPVDLLFDNKNMYIKALT